MNRLPCWNNFFSFSSWKTILVFYVVIISVLILLFLDCFLFSVDNRIHHHFNVVQRILMFGFLYFFPFFVHHFLSFKFSFYVLFFWLSCFFWTCFIIPYCISPWSVSSVILKIHINKAYLLLLILNYITSFICIIRL